MRTGALVAFFLLANACGSDPPFTLDVRFSAHEDWGGGVYWVVSAGDGPSNLRRELPDAGIRPDKWRRQYSSHGAALDELARTPLRVDCYTAGHGSCGTAHVDAVCEWAISTLEPSPIVSAELSVGFSADGTASARETKCEAQDGTTTHLNPPMPDAGP